MSDKGLQEVTLRDALGRAYTVLVKPREEIERRFAALDLADLASLVYDKGWPVEDHILELSIELTTGNLIGTWRPNCSESEAIVRHRLPVCRLDSGGSFCYDVDDILGEQQYEQLPVTRKMSWYTRQDAFEQASGYIVWVKAFLQGLIKFEMDAIAGFRERLLTEVYGGK